MRLEDFGEDAFDGLAALDAFALFVDDFSVGDEQGGDRLGVAAVVRLGKGIDHEPNRLFVVLLPAAAAVAVKAAARTPAMIIALRMLKTFRAGSLVISDQTFYRARQVPRRLCLRQSRYACIASSCDLLTREPEEFQVTELAGQKFPSALAGCSSGQTGMSAPPLGYGLRAASDCRAWRARRTASAAQGFSP